MGLRPLACWDCGIESRRRHGCMSAVSVLCCQVEVSVSGWSLVQRSPTDCGVYEGESNGNLKYFYPVIYWIQNVLSHFIFLCSLHCVPYKCSVLRKSMNTSRKKFFWLREQPLVRRPLHLLVRPEGLASHHLFERSKDMKVTGEARSGEYGGCGRHSKDRSWIVATVERAVWGRALSCWSKPPVLRRPRRLD